MGVDIHIFIEKRNNETNQWESLNLYKKNEDGSFEQLDVYDGRDSELFGLLAGVRNPFALSSILGYGCGCLVEPRGLPKNMSQAAEDEWGDGDGLFGATWYDYCELELSEHLLVDANKELEKSNKRIAELNREIKKLKDEEDEDCYDLFDDEDDDYNVIDSFNGFMNCIRDVLRAYGIYYTNPNKIRILMWFDN